MRNNNVALRAVENDKIFKWMVFRNGGFWIFIKDFFGQRRGSWDGQWHDNRQNPENKHKA